MRFELGSLKTEVLTAPPNNLEKRDANAKKYRADFELRVFRARKRFAPAFYSSVSDVRLDKRAYGCGDAEKPERFAYRVLDRKSRLVDEPAKVRFQSNIPHQTYTRFLFTCGYNTMLYVSINSTWVLKSRTTFE